MELHHLRHFVAVAEELHFGRAASRLGMAQPPLSRSIQRLEASLGYTLFARDRSKVAMTSAGLALLEYARAILTRVELAERMVRRAAEGQLDILRVGFVPLSLIRALPRAVRKFNLKWPGVRLRLYENVSYKQVDLLKSGKLDLAIVSLQLADISGLEVAVVGHTRLVIAAPADWPIAKQDSVRFADLAELPFVDFLPQVNLGLRAALNDPFLHAGFFPRIVHQTGQSFTVLNMVANEVGVALLHSTAAEMEVQGVRFLPIDDAPASFDSDIALVWNAMGVTPPLASFVEVVKASCAEAPSRPGK